MHRKTGGLTGLELLEGALHTGMVLAAVAVVGITGYYVLATWLYPVQLLNGLTPQGKAMPTAEFQQVLRNIELLGRLLALAALVAALCAIARYFSYVETGAVLMLVGAALAFGVTFLIDNKMGTKQYVHPSLVRFGNPGLMLKAKFALAGMELLALGAMHLFYHAVAWFSTSKSRRPRADAEAARLAQQVRKPHDQFLGPCWNLPFCRDTEKRLCPIRASKKPCWRTGRGCYCDQNIVLTLSGGSQYAASRGSAGYLSRAATLQRPKTLREKREQCLSCPIYLHHQDQKYKLTAPAALLFAGGGLFLFREPLFELWPTLVTSAGRSLSGLSIGTKAGSVPDWVKELASNQPLTWMILGVCTLLAVAYLLHFVEWILYRLGL